MERTAETLVKRMWRFTCPAAAAEDACSRSISISRRETQKPLTWLRSLSPSSLQSKMTSQNITHLRRSHRLDKTFHTGQVLPADRALFKTASAPHGVDQDRGHPSLYAAHCHLHEIVPINGSCEPSRKTSGGLIYAKAALQINTL